MRIFSVSVPSQRVFTECLGLRNGLIVILAVLFAVVAGTPSLYGQALSGISGTVTDSTGAVVEGASVTITNPQTGVVAHTKTGSAGTYAVTDLTPGIYTVKVEQVGFNTSQLSGVRVEVATKTTADAVLQAGGATEVVQVASPAVGLEIEQPDNGTTVEQALVQELPNEFGNAIGARDRQIDNFLSLTPGYTGSSFSHRINGGEDFQNEVVFAGIPAAQSETQGLQTNINPPFELVDQFRVLNSVFSPQYGLGQGVAVYGFASGKNAIHGDAFEITRNSYLDAPGVNPVGSTTDASGNFTHKPTPFDIEHNFGFSVGGPVYIPHLYDGRNKTFFFFTSDWYRFNSAVSGVFTVPTAAELGGNFSALLAQSTPILAPSSGWTPPAGCNVAPGQQFTGNVIPAACFSAISKSVLPLLPSVNTAANVAIANIPSQITTDPTRQFNWGFNLDHNISSSQVLHVSYWRDKWSQPLCCDNNALFAASNPLTGIKQEPRLGTGVFVSYAKTFSNNLVMTAGMGWLGEINNETNEHLGTNFPGVAGSQTFPTIIFHGPNSPGVANGREGGWGAGAGGESFSNNRKLGLSWANNWLYNHGRNTWNFGFDARRAYQDDQEEQQSGGRFEFSNLTTGNSFASFLLGVADSAQRQFALEEHLRNFAFSPYVQDNLKVTRKLTLNLGMRWDILRPFTENNNNIVFFDPNLSNPGAISAATGKPLLGALTKFGNCTGCAGFTRASIDWHQFSPRFGFAYEMNQKTAILGGFAVNRLNGGAFEFGTNKVAVNYGNLLAGEFSRPSLGSATPGYGLWDNNPLPQIAATPFSSTIGNGFGVSAFNGDDGFAPYNQAWNLGIQRELPGNMVVTASYLGNKGVHLASQLNPINQLNPGRLSLCAGNPQNCVLGAQWTSPAAQTVLQNAGYGQSGGLFTPYANFINDFPNASLQQALSPFPQYQSIFDNFEHQGASSYNALQLQAERRFTNGISFLVNYSLSRLVSNANSGFTSFEATALNKFNPKPEYTIDNNDQTHIINIALVYELPLGPGKKFLTHGGTVARELLNGWQFSTISQYGSGTPLDGAVPTIGAPGSPLGTGNRGDYNGAPVSVDWNNYYKGLPVFTTSAFNVPAGCAPNAGCFVLGNSPRTLGVIRGPWNQNENMSVAKHFSLGERVSMELRVEYFNIFNRVTICGADNNTNDSGFFGVVSGNGTPGSFTPCQQNSPRQGQGFLKVQF
jgi:Carboxypeptidase regulatory-like domain